MLLPKRVERCYNCCIIIGVLCIRRTFWIEEVMNEKVTNNNELIEIDIKRLWSAVWSRLWLVALSSVICGVLAFIYTIYMITPLYKSSAMFYVNNSDISLDGASLSVSSSDISASKSLVDTYIVILKSRACLNDVIDYADLNYTYSELGGMISAASVSSTEVFKVVVTSPDAKEAEKIANAIAYILPKRITEIVEGTSAKIVDYAVVAAAPSSPSRPKNAVIGFLIGFIVSVGFIVLRELFDTTIRGEEDITQSCKHPILATVPDMTASPKGKYYSYYGYGNNRAKKRSAPGTAETVLTGAGISFAASEAYKLLRTKLQFSFTDDKKCRVIGVSSAFAGEGKSLSAVNLSYALAQLEKRVLLIDCDMRRPSLAVKLNIRKIPGLSNYLTGNAKMEELIQNSDGEPKAGSFSVIAAGRNPPNPIELLSSNKMAEAIETLREEYDYIILDLPPVGEVSDAMATANLVDGILLVVCQNYCNRIAFSTAVNQFEFVGARILGIVMNRVSDHARGYGNRYYYYKRYYKRYGYYKSRYGYGYGYGAYETAASNESDDTAGKEKQ